MAPMGKTTYYPKPKRLDKLSKEKQLDLMFDLINAFRLVKTPFETALLIQDLLTASEIKHLAKRLRIAKLLLSGEIQRDIAEKLHCSLATVTKVSIWLNQGGEGLREIIAKLPERYPIPKKLPKKPIEFQLPQVLLALAQYSVATHQQKQIKKLGKFLEDVENKKVLDKVLQEMFDEEFRPLRSEKKRKATSKL